MNLKQMLVEMLNRKASDLHIRVGIRPHLRVNGRLEQIATDPITIDRMDQVVGQILNERQLERFQRKNEMDLALSVAKLGRFRINLFRQRGTTGVAIRAVNTQVPSFNELNLPQPVKDLASEHRDKVDELLARLDHYAAEAVPAKGSYELKKPPGWKEPKVWGEPD